MALTGLFRRSGGEGQDLEAVPAEHPFRRRQVGLAPVAVDGRAILAAIDLDALQDAAHRLRKRRPPLRHLNRAARVGDAGERMRQDDARIGKQPAPVAGMMPALPQIDDQVDQMAAARAEKQRRPIGRDARPVGCDQEIGLEQPVLVEFAQLSQADRAELLAHLDQELDVEPERPALGEHGGDRGDIDGVLALVVGGAAPVPAVAFDRQRPGRQPRAPQRIEAADGVAVAIDQDGHAERRPRCARRSGTAALRRRGFGRMLQSKAERGKARHHLVFEIGAQAPRRAPAPGWSSESRPGAEGRRGSCRRRNGGGLGQWRRRGSWAQSARGFGQPCGCRHAAVERSAAIDAMHRHDLGMAAVAASRQAPHRHDTLPGMRRSLRLHPDSLCAAVTQIEVEVARPRAGSLVLHYLVSGEISALRLPPVMRGRTHRRAVAAYLLRGIRPSLCQAPAYYEFNFAPSTQWAAYRFDGYRAGMRASTDTGAPRIAVQSARQSFTLQATLELDRSLPPDTRMASWSLGGDRGNKRPHVVLGAGASTGQAGFPSSRLLCHELAPA